MYKTNVYIPQKTGRVRKPRVRQLWNLYKPSYGRFCAKIAQILLPWHQGLVQENFIGTIKSAVPENPVWCELGGSSICTRRVMADFVQKSRIFVTMVTRVSPGKNSMVPLHRPSPKTPFVANSVALAFVQAELWPIWVENGQKFKIQYLKEYLTTLHQTSIRTGP